MSFSVADIRALAELARLELTKEEEAKYQQDLAGILEFVGKLTAVDTRSVSELDETSYVGAYRKDEAREMSNKQEHDAIIGAFPVRVGEALSVPAVFEKPKG